MPSSQVIVPQGLEEATSFLNAVFRDTRHRLLVWEKQSKRSRQFRTAEDAARYAVERAGDSDVYFAIATIGRPIAPSFRNRAEDFYDLPVLVADIDTCEKGSQYPTLSEAKAALDAMPWQPSVIVLSGTGGLHGYWFLEQPLRNDGPEALERARRLLRRNEELLRSLLGGKHLDAVAEPARVLRVPGTWNHSANAPVVLAHLDADCRYLAEDIEAELDRRLPQPQAPKYFASSTDGFSAPVADAETESKLRRMALESAVRDGRNNAAFWLSCQLRDHGFAQDEAERSAEAYQQQAEPLKGAPYGLNEALASVRSAFSRSPRSAFLVARQPERIAPEAGEEIELGEYRRRMLENVLKVPEKPGIYLLNAPPGAGKSHAAIELLKTVASSQTVLPSHDLVRERCEEMQAAGLDAGAFPQRSKDTCPVYFEEAKPKEALGVSPCPMCRLKGECAYMKAMKEAESRPHQLLTQAAWKTNKRRQAEVTVVDEKGFDAFAKVIPIGRGELQQLDDILRYATYQSGFTALQEAEVAASRMFEEMRKVVGILLVELERGATRQLPMPEAVDPGRWEGAWLKAVRESGARGVQGDKFRALLALMRGDAAGLGVRVADRGKGSEDRAIIVREETAVGEEEVILVTDGTAAPEAIELVTGIPPRNITPPGKIRRKKPLWQIPVWDIKVSTQPREAARRLISLVATWPRHWKIGLQGHGKHLEKVLALLPWSIRTRIPEGLVCPFNGTLDRGSNRWHAGGCDVLIRLGSFRPPAAAIQDELIARGQWDEAAMDGCFEEYRWLDQDGVAHTGLRYGRPSWRKAHDALAAACDLQGIERGRGVLDDGVSLTIALSSTPIPGAKVISPPAELSDGAWTVAEALSRVWYPQGGVANAHSALVIPLGKMSDKPSPLRSTQLGLVEPASTVRRWVSEGVAAGWFTRESARGGLLPTEAFLAAFGPPLPRPAKEEASLALFDVTNTKPIVVEEVTHALADEGPRFATAEEEDGCGLDPVEAFATAVRQEGVGGQASATTCSASASASGWAEIVTWLSDEKPDESPPPASYHGGLTPREIASWFG